ncbi:hypothetical protein EDC01DRAFT_629367 [Geopyxis carbonaria]|nr:hypothetical protein EDC01DRAFT_629367 [Geopyxis carbonaria]
MPHELDALELYIKNYLLNIFQHHEALQHEALNVLTAPWGPSRLPEGERQQALAHRLDYLSDIVEHPRNPEEDIDIEMTLELSCFLTHGQPDQFNATEFVPSVSTGTLDPCFSELSTHSTGISSMDSCNGLAGLDQFHELNSELNYSEQDTPIDSGSYGYVPLDSTNSIINSSIAFSNSSKIPVSTPAAKSTAKSGAKSGVISKSKGRGVTKSTDQHLFQCGYCTKTYSKKAELNRHWTQATKGCTEKMDSSKGQCKSCGKTMDNGRDHAGHFGHGIETEFLPQEWRRQRSELHDKNLGAKVEFPYFMRLTRKKPEDPWIPDHVEFIRNPKNPQEPKDLCK